MTALELLRVANQVIFVGLFAAVLWHALRQPSRAAWDTVLLFGSIASVEVEAGPDGGSRFVVSVPLAEPTTVEQPAPEAT